MSKVYHHCRRLSTLFYKRWQ